MPIGVKIIQTTLSKVFFLDIKKNVICYRMDERIQELEERERQLAEKELSLERREKCLQEREDILLMKLPMSRRIRSRVPWTAEECQILLQEFRDSLLGRVFTSTEKIERVRRRHE